MAFTFVEGSAICTPAALAYVLLRSGSLWCSPVGVGDSIQWSCIPAHRVQVGYVQMIWVQYITEYSSVCPTVLCFFHEKERKKGGVKWPVAIPKAD
jgi:hypothetical protein